MKFEMSNYNSRVFGMLILSERQMELTNWMWLNPNILIHTKNYERYRYGSYDDLENRDCEWVYNGLILSRVQEDEFLNCQRFDEPGDPPGLRRRTFPFHEWLFYKKDYEWMERVVGMEKSLESWKCHKQCAFNECAHCQDKETIRIVLVALRWRLQNHTVDRYPHDFQEFRKMVPREKFCKMIPLDDIVENIQEMHKEICNWCGPDHYSKYTGFYPWLYLHRYHFNSAVWNLRKHRKVTEQMETLSLR